MTNPKNEDLQHPLQVEKVTVVDSTEDAKVFIHRPDVRSGTGHKMPVVSLLWREHDSSLYTSSSFSTLKLSQGSPTFFSITGWSILPSVWTWTVMPRRKLCSRTWMAPFWELLGTWCHSLSLSGMETSAGAWVITESPKSCSLTLMGVVSQWTKLPLIKASGSFLCLVSHFWSYIFYDLFTVDHWEEE